MLLTLVMLIAASPMQASPPESAPTPLFRQACVDTAGDRSAFEALAAEAEWTPLRYDARPDLHRDWVSGFRVGETEIRLSHFAQWSEPEEGGVSRSAPEQIICSVETRVASKAWRDDLSEIVIAGTKLRHAEELDTSLYQGLPEGYEADGWRISDDISVHATYRSSDRLLELSINYFPEP